jgi:hypothetical protein
MRHLTEKRQPAPLHAPQRTDEGQAPRAGGQITTVAGRRRQVVLRSLMTCLILPETGSF